MVIPFPVTAHVPAATVSRQAHVACAPVHDAGSASHAAVSEVPPSGLMGPPATTKQYWVAESQVTEPVPHAKESAPSGCTHLPATHWGGAEAGQLHTAVPRVFSACSSACCTAACADAFTVEPPHVQMGEQNVPAVTSTQSLAVVQEVSSLDVSMSMH
jgi:hypothetical protein